MPTAARTQPDGKKRGKKVKVENAPAEKTPDYEANIPEPSCRADLLKYWMDLSMDDKTANKALWIKDGGATVSRMTDELKCPVLERQERFEYVPQVLCKEGILGFRAYWEVMYTGWVVLGVTYAGAGRRITHGMCGLGENEESWGLGWAGSCYHAWYNGLKQDIKEKPCCSVLGVYLDQPAGIIHFYGIEEGAGKKEVRLLQRIQTSLKDKMMPGFWVGLNSCCSIVKKEE